MKVLMCAAVLLAVCWAVESKHTPPTVKVYSHGPGEFGKDNIFICHVSDFHPPDISIQLLEDKVELPTSTQTDLAFNADWHFHLTRSAPFTPKEGVQVLCRVTHGGKVTNYAWDPNM